MPSGPFSISPTTFRTPISFGPSSRLSPAMPIDTTPGPAIPSPQSLSEQLLRTAAEHSLRAFLEPNAVFLAQLLHTTYPSSASANLLATAHLRQGDFSKAAQVLNPPTTPENRYLYAVCLTRIGTPDALRDAEACLRGPSGLIDFDMHMNAPSYTPGSAAGSYLLGTICQRTGRKDEAIALYRRALNANPTLWLAFEALSSMGIVTKSEVVLPVLSDAEALERLQQQPQFFPHTAETITPRPLKPPRESAALRPHSNSMRHLSARTPLESGFVTPSPTMGRLQARSFNEMRTPSAPHHGGRHGLRRSSRISGSPNTGINGLRLGRRSRNVALDDSSVRNPADLFAATPNREPRSVTMPVGHPLSGKEDSISVRELAHSADDDKNDIASAMDLVRSLGQIVSELSRFRCARAIELSNCLPSKHRNSGFVLSLRGRAFLERGDYVAAEQEFKKALAVDPMRTDGVVEYYSTVLWHLKKEKALAQLAINAQRIHPVSSSAWCAAGNCYSIQQDPDAAIKFFKRAIITSRAPNAYAYTLCGHEYVVKEDFDSALAAYREALNIDERHYNAIYGIGQVLQKQEKFGLAQNHFRSAVLVNPLNSTLHYHLGVSMAAGVGAIAGTDPSYKTTRHALISALAELETAANLDPRNPVPRFERAKILVAMNRLPDARKQLEDLRESLPKEAEVHYELSRVCQRLGDAKEAMQALHTALDIEPKERKYKKALDSLGNEYDGTLSL
ncbi:Cell division cycle protein 27-like [Gracilariopsis chorda]|uniref:Cell division cycle protein 27-like n=1 Tax=Gracilariopsis chorda TaxID=448386 RepID=A0A2V3J5C5_9FLOR|nr:Cell division cycle protein 27-like [Gracilariopsis chorda]|eukprot:PXF48580.1 Cell division cycle protein 27-like [Gracilariopsis chorda]